MQNIKEAEEIVGGLSKPSKMPGYAFSIPAKECKTGAKLREVKGSTCEKCYALKGRYVFSNTQNALYRRLKAIDDPRWVEAMAYLLNARAPKQPFFRWHDSGDIQSVGHLSKICEVARLTPLVQHWLPTREYGFVGEYVKDNEIPANLTIRLSAFMNDVDPPTKLAERLGCVTSNVSSKGEFTCPSSKQDNKCGDCRACWDKEVSNVTYKKH